MSESIPSVANFFLEQLPAHFKRFLPRLSGFSLTDIKLAAFEFEIESVGLFCVQIKNGTLQVRRGGAANPVWHMNMSLSAWSDMYQYVYMPMLNALEEAPVVNVENLINNQAKAHAVHLKLNWKQPQLMIQAISAKPMQIDIKILDNPGIKWHFLLGTAEEDAPLVKVEMQFSTWLALAHRQMTFAQAWSQQLIHLNGAVTTLMGLLSQLIEKA